MGDVDSVNDWASTVARYREERQWRNERMQDLTAIGQQIGDMTVEESTWREASEWTIDDSTLFSEATWGDSDSQGLRYLHSFGVTRDQFNLQMSVNVNSHEEHSSHTWYMIQCSLSGGKVGVTPLSWNSPRRLCQLRGLHDYVSGHLTEYNRHFKDTQFVLPMAPPGTTARLQKWLQRLVGLLTEAKLPVSVAAAVLDFFQAHHVLATENKTSGCEHAGGEARAAQQERTVEADSELASEQTEAMEAPQENICEARSELASQQTIASDFTVTLTKPDDQTPLGMELKISDPSNFTVNSINAGLVANWNAANPTVAIKQDDVIVSINGVSGKEMLALAQTKTVLEILVRRLGSS